MHAPPALFVPLKPSRQCAAAVLLIHLAALAGIALADLPVWLVGLGCCALAFSCVHLLRLHALQLAPKAIIRLQSRADGRLECLTREGEWLSLRLLPYSTLFPACAVLCLKPAGGGKSLALTLFPDAQSTEDWRMLRVWLRWQAGHLPENGLSQGPAS